MFHNIYFIKLFKVKYNFLTWKNYQVHGYLQTFCYYGNPGSHRIFPLDFFTPQHDAKMPGRRRQPRSYDVVQFRWATKAWLTSVASFSQVALLPAYLARHCWLTLPGGWGWLLHTQSQAPGCEVEICYIRNRSWFKVLNW